MKKNGIILIGLLVLVTLFVGCSQDALGDYKKAVDKTDSITMGKSTTTGSITVDVDTTGLNDADRKQADLLKDISFKTTKMTNTKDLKSTTIGYLNFGGMGFDYGIYVNGEEKYIKIPVVNKFMALNELTKNTDFSSYNYAEMISPETIKQLEKIWMDNLKNNNIFKGSNTVVETGDGSVKVKKYTLSMDHNEMDRLMPRFMDVILKDEKLIRYIESRSDEKIEPDQMAVIIKKMSDSISFDKFEVTTLVDVDGYIVDETTDVVIAFKEGNLKKIALLIQENNFEIEKEQIIDFPTMDANNTITMEELSKEMPKNFEDILK